MKIIDPGHVYQLDSLDGKHGMDLLVFVKREGPKYPGNVGSHPGTTTQEVLRALIERCQYVNAQRYSEETRQVELLLIRAIVMLERRAARLHGRAQEFAGIDEADVVAGTGKCASCGHVGCPGDCHKEHR